MGSVMGRRRILGADIKKGAKHRGTGILEMSKRLAIITYGWPMGGRDVEVRRPRGFMRSAFGQGLCPQPRTPNPERLY